FFFYYNNLCFQVVESQYVPKTCQCPQAKIRIKGPFSDFKVTPKGPNYSKCTFIRQKNNNHVCLSPEGRQGKRLLKCWQSTQKDGKDSKKCIHQQDQKPRRRNRKHVKSRKVTS
uniref:Chemokine interleukin-8-like domain-containing protein n=1 Tax=Sinocyclocheilus rhinocerous TaxID=307959 RepID=A0A673JBI5_9TELE